MRVIEKSWNEFWAYRWRIEHRHTIPGIFEWDKKLVDFIENVCDLSPGMRILDLGCGGGDQAKVFAEKGYRMHGVDIAPPLIEFAKKQFDDRNLSATFEVGDMRSISYICEFDACVILSGTFGFFSDKENLKLLFSIQRALKNKGKVFITFLGMDRIQKRIRSWSKVKEGWELDETWLDYETSTRCANTIIIYDDGTIIKPKDEPGYHANERIRCYSLPEIKGMLEQAGFEFITSFNSRDLDLPVKQPDASTPHDIVVAQKK